MKCLEATADIDVMIDRKKEWNFELSGIRKTSI